MFPTCKKKKKYYIQVQFSKLKFLHVLRFCKGKNQVCNRWTVCLCQPDTIKVKKNISSRKMKFGILNLYGNAI